MYFCNRDACGGEECFVLLEGSGGSSSLYELAELRELRGNAED